MFMLNRRGEQAGPPERVADLNATPAKDITMTNLSAFLKDETGAVTVDWVVLTAAVVGLGLLVYPLIRLAVSNLASDIAAELDQAGSTMVSSGTAAAANP